MEQIFKDSLAIAGKNITSSQVVEAVMKYENALVVKRFCSEYAEHALIADFLFTELKKFLVCCALSDHPMTPHFLVDKMWHAFIEFTIDYEAFCLGYFGCFIHHIPDMKLSPESIAKNQENFLVTIQAIKHIFPEQDSSFWAEKDASRCDGTKCSHCCNAKCSSKNIFSYQFKIAA